MVALRLDSDLKATRLVLTFQRFLAHIQFKNWCELLLWGLRYRLYSTKLRLCHITTMVVVPSGCSGFFGPRSQMDHMGHFMKSCKMLLLLQIVWYYVEVVSHYYYGSGTFGVFSIFRSKVPNGPYGPFMKSCKMLLLLQIVWYYVEVVSHYYYGSGTFGVFSIFWSKVPNGPFYEIMQNTSSPRDCILHCWGFVTLVLWKWYHLGVQHFGVQGAKWAI